MNGGHHLSARIKGNLADSYKLVFLCVLGKAEGLGVIYESALGGLSHCRADLGIKLCVGTEGHSVCQKRFVIAVVVYNSHLVLCESTCFIGADYLSATESLNCRKLTDDGVSLGHIGNADGENDGNNGCKTFGDSRYRKGDGDHKGIEDGLEAYTVTNELNSENNNADADNEIGEDL